MSQTSPPPSSTSPGTPPPPASSLPNGLHSGLHTLGETVHTIGDHPLTRQAASMTSAAVSRATAATIDTAIHTLQTLHPTTLAKGEGSSIDGSLHHNEADSDAVTLDDGIEAFTGLLHR